MIKSNFKPRTVNTANKKTYSINQFLGVDYSSQKFQIDNNRAIDILNYVYRDGVVQNRHGITQILHIEPTKYIKLNFDDTYDEDNEKYNDINFNSIWQFLGEDNKQHIIAHIGKLLYEIKNIDNEEKIEYIPLYVFKKGNIPVCYEFENYKSEAFVGGNKLWFLGGNKYMVIRFLESKGLYIKPVENSDLVQIPTTTISITYVNSIVANRSSYDTVNLLTSWRKNKLLSGTGKNENAEKTTEFYKYVLDSPLISSSEEQLKKDMAQFEIIIEQMKEGSK